MRVEMTVVDDVGGPGVDVSVGGPPGTPLGAVLADLAGACGWDEHRRGPAVVHAAGLPVPVSARVGEPPLVRGAVLVLGAAHESGGDGRWDGGGGSGGRRGPWLRVVGGSDAGAEVRPPLGRSRLGRAPGSLVALTDPAVSPVHLELDTSPSGCAVRDAGSVNGSLLDESPLGTAWRLLAPGSVVRLGRTTLRLEAPVGPFLAEATARTVPDGRGHLLVPAAPGTAHPHADTSAEGVTVVLLPTPTAPREPSATAWPAVLAPVVVAVPLALLWSPLALLLALTGPLVAVLTRGAERRSGRRRRREDVAEHDRATAAARSRAARLAEREADHLDRLHPDPAAVRRAAVTAGPSVWSAPAGAPLVVRVGSARVPSSTVLRRPRSEGAAAAEEEDERVHLDRGPVVVDLARLEHLVVEAADDAGAGAVRCLLGQLAVHHAPDQLRVHVRTARSESWSWLRWLPHTGDRPGVRCVLVDDGGPGAATTLTVRDPAGGAEGTGTAVLRLDADGAATWSGPLPGPLPDPLPHEREDALDLAVDLVSDAWAEEVARGLAPLLPGPGRGRARGTGSETPTLRELLSAVGPDPADAAAVAAAWRSEGPLGSTGRPRPRALPLGVHADGSPWTVDLERDGPHALVAGTTGSGKSTLLVAMVLAAAVAEPPDELAVVVVDYKGGATAGRLRGLPHLVGAVTDLDEHLARRALESLRAEVRRRERVLAEHGAVDRAALLALRPDGARVLPRLLVVVDEVRVLTEEVPELVPGLVRLAAVGRSLGVHLVLSTQRPAGVVSADARANTNLRVALRVRDVPDSLDVVDDPGAAHLPPDRPGAALVRRGGEALQPVHVATARRRLPPPVGVQVRGTDGWAGDADPGSEGEDEVPAVVAALAAAAHGLARTPPPWLPPLPDVLGWRSPGPGRRGPGGAPASGGPTPCGGLPLGLVDDPTAPDQRPLVWSGTSPLLLAGGPGTGRTSLLRWLAAAAGPDREVHVVGDPAELGHLGALPQVRSVVDPNDGEHLLRVLAALSASRAATAAAPGSASPLLLVDRADRVLALPGTATGHAHDRYEAEAAADHLRRLVDDGAAVVLTGDPALLTSRAVAAVREVLLLAPADRTAALLAGVPGAALPVHWPPGRALVLRSGPVRECQLALLGGAAALDEEGGVAAQRAVVAELAQVAELAGPSSAPAGLPAGGADRGRVPPLPRHLSLAELRLLNAPSELGARDGGGAPLLVGVGGRQVRPVGLHLPAGSGAAVVGAAGSGRSSALRLLARQGRDAGRRVVEVLPRPGPAGAGGDHDGHADVVVRGTDAVAARQLAAVLEEAAGGDAPAGLVLVDDAELVAGSSVEGVLLTLLDSPDLPWAVVAAGTSGQVPAHRGLFAALRRHRTGLLLHPVAPGDAEVVGARPSPVRGGPPGRASAVRGGELDVVQLAQG